MKKRSIKKVLALGLAGAMLCGMLTACGGDTPANTTTAANSTAVLPHRLLRQRDRQSLQLPKQRRRRSCFGICGPV